MRQAVGYLVDAGVGDATSAIIEDAGTDIRRHVQAGPDHVGSERLGVRLPNVTSVAV